MTQRLQKILSDRGVCSRRKAETLLIAGRISVNGVPAKLGDSADPDRDRILLDGEPIPGKSTEEKLYLALHKPRGYLTTVSDDRGRRTVMDLVQDAPGRVYPVGRLDLDSEGLLLMTNDGDFANRVMHPSFEKNKLYQVWVTGNAAAAVEPLRRPLEIDGCRVQAVRATLLQGDESGGVLRLLIREGRNRQIRKMCAAVGLHVTRLLRLAVGPVRLGKLPRGAWRPLTAEEIAALSSDNTSTHRRPDNE